MVSFIKEIQQFLSEGNLESAIGNRDEQKGPVANVIVSALHKYQAAKKEKGMTKEQQIASIQKEIQGYASF